MEIDRRTIVKGAVWTVPVVSIAATAPAFSASLCGVTGGISVGPNVAGTAVRAICESQSQWLNPGTINANYGVGTLPRVITICSCDGLAGWYRWKETDTRSNFQIEVDGVHSDQNGPLQGYRPAFFLNIADSCKTFNLTYRTSDDLPNYPQTSNFSITWTLERLTAGTVNTPSAVWGVVQTITRAVTVGRKQGGGSANFNVCSAGGTQGRNAGTSSE